MFSWGAQSSGRLTTRYAPHNGLSEGAIPSAPANTATVQALVVTGCILAVAMNLDRIFAVIGAQ